MSFKQFIAYFVCFFFFSLTAMAGFNTDRPDGHAPIGVMGDHTHHKGEWMLSYRYMRMTMSDNLDGTTEVSKDDIHNDFMVAPLEMDMDMHMFGAMYAVNDNLTLMSMIPYLEFSMDLENRMGKRFTTESNGIGDLKLTTLYNILVWQKHKIHLNLGFSAPTGSVTEKDDTPAGNNQKLPYPMQVGSGTFDLLPGITYVGMEKNYSWGGQISGTIRMGRNDEGYSLGERLELTTWGSRKWTKWMSSSLRFKYENWGNVDGRDGDLNPMMVPTARGDLRGGQKVEILMGLNLYGNKGWKKDHRLAFELGIPVYQHLDGPHPETDWSLVAGWQYAW